MRPGCPSGRHDADRIHLVCVRIFWSNKELRGAWRQARPHSSLVFFWYTIAPGSVLVFPKVPRSIRFSRCPPARPRRAARSYIARTGRPRGRESGAPHFLHVPRGAPARARAPDGRGRRPGRGRGIRLAARDPCKEIVAPSEPQPESRAIGAEGPYFYENEAAPYVCATALSVDRRPLPQKTPAHHRPACTLRQSHPDARRAAYAI